MEVDPNLALIERLPSRSTSALSGSSPAPSADHSGVGKAAWASFMSGFSTGLDAVPVRRKPSQQLPTLEEERSLLPFEDQFFDVGSANRLGTVYCVKVVGVLFRSHQCPISRVFVASLR